MRRTGSAALNLCYVAAGRFDAYFARETKTWDVAAGWLLIREAGGIVTDINGGPCHLDNPRFIAAGSETLRQEIETLLWHDALVSRVRLGRVCRSASQANAANA